MYAGANLGVELFLDATENGVESSMMRFSYAQIREPLVIQENSAAHPSNHSAFPARGDTRRLSVPAFQKRVE
jgi:hypothetical protein